MDVERKTFNSQYIKDEEGRLLRDNALIRERWVRWFHKVVVVVVDQGYDRGGTPIFTGVFEPLARVAL